MERLDLYLIDDINTALSMFETDDSLTGSTHRRLPK